MLKFVNCSFNAQGANKKDKVYGLTLSGSDNVLVKDCFFKNTGYSSILNESEGNVEIKDCIFVVDNVYNPIEGSQTVENGNVEITGCSFSGVPGNNFINFYSVSEYSDNKIINCVFNGSTGNNIVRLSNRSNNSATFTIEDCYYDYSTGAADEYTGFMLCQDYTNKSGSKQNFSKYTVNVNNVERPEEGS